mmetsp:Transcript_32126/g.61828  ORF Transcript_32126/g.61828 Transcript_32126/m.61828 type:complete len:115 (-) Transcript_32126:582-926(-)
MGEATAEVADLVGKEAVREEATAEAADLVEAAREEAAREAVVAGMEADSGGMADSEAVMGVVEDLAGKEGGGDSCTPRWKRRKTQRLCTLPGMDQVIRRTFAPSLEGDVANQQP